MLKKSKHRGSIIPSISVDGIKIHNAKKIANSFGEFYSTLGSKLASDILPGTTSIDEYINSIPRQLTSLALNGTTVPEVEHFIR